VRLKRKTTIPRNSSDEEPEELRATLGEHLEELRTRILRIVYMLAIAWVVGWYIQPPVYDYINELVLKAIKQAIPTVVINEAFTNATQAFMLKFKLSFMLGLVMVIPFIVLQLWGFVAPGLKPNEKAPIKKLVPYTVFLFFLGVGCCWLILPSAFIWFAAYISDFKGAILNQEPGTLVFFVLKMLLAFGLGFQLPIVVFFLGKLGILTPETLTAHWRHATVAVFTISAMITPSNDIFSMLMMAVPLSILFVISVYAVKITSRKSKGSAEPDDDV